VEHWWALQLIFSVYFLKFKVVELNLHPQVFVIRRECHVLVHSVI